jgi:hypothetical protein
MESRYLGFDQSDNAREYRFDGIEKDEPIQHFVVTADPSLFFGNWVGVQEGPAMSANKLAADLEIGKDDAHELTADDLRVRRPTGSHGRAHVRGRQAPCQTGRR